MHRRETSCGDWSSDFCRRCENRRRTHESFLRREAHARSSVHSRAARRARSSGDDKSRLVVEAPLAAVTLRIVLNRLTTKEILAKLEEKMRWAETLLRRRRIFRKRDAHRADLCAKIVYQQIQLFFPGNGRCDHQVSAVLGEHDGEAFECLDDAFHEDDVTRDDAQTARDQTFTDERTRHDSIFARRIARERVVRFTFGTCSFFAHAVLDEAHQFVDVAFERRTHDTRAPDKMVSVVDDEYETGVPSVSKNARGLFAKRSMPGVRKMALVTFAGMKPRGMRLPPARANSSKTRRAESGLRIHQDEILRPADRSSRPIA